MDTPLVVIGASVRAAAFSALRAGLRPRAIDLFGDRDLSAACPARVVPNRRYPAMLAQLARQAPPGPWMYTGALENWPGLVEEISRERPLWGNDAASLRRVRDPFALAAAIEATGLRCPAVRRIDETPATGHWLLKPFSSGGGTGIRIARGANSGRLRSPARPAYLQEFVEGESRSGIFIAGPNGCRLLGVTRQLVGESWVHSLPFRYAGSIGPLTLSMTERAAWERLGVVIAAFAGLRGLFGIDAVIRDGVPWPVEVNPRYTASVEVIEYATGMWALALQAQAFEGASVEPSGRRVFAAPTSALRLDARPGVVGKAVWFAPRAITVPTGGPWEAVLRQPPAIDSPPAFADIPPAGQRIAAGRPVLTMFATGATAAECQRRLQTVATELDSLLLR
jgi:predicted ATP-grasp superfamily ATP-dependent carboligase